MSNSQSLGSYLRDTRKEKQSSMRALAKGAEISVAYLSKIEQDLANPTIDVLERIAKALDVTVSDLTQFKGTSEVRISNMPESLKDFISKYSSEFSQLNDPEYQRMLSGIRFREKYPENSGEWLRIFSGIVGVLEKS